MADQLTLTELLAMQASVEQGLASLSLGPTQAAFDLLATAEASSLVTDLEDLVARLPDGVAKTQVNNVVLVLRNVPIALAGEIQRLSALLTLGGNATPAA